MSRISNLALAALVGAAAGYVTAHVDDIAQAAQKAAAEMDARSEATRARFLNAIQTSSDPEVITLLGRTGLGTEFTVEMFFRIPLHEQLAIVSLVFGRKASEAFAAARKSAK